jgi:hypothetical protein
MASNIAHHFACFNISQETDIFYDKIFMFLSQSKDNKIQIRNISLYFLKWFIRK